MPRKKATFESKDLTSPQSDEPVVPDIEEGNSSPTEIKYEGKERRQENRRLAKDRRTDVRFDTTKVDRRETQGHRKDDFTPKFW